MKTVINIWTVALIFTLPTYFFTGAILGTLFPTAPEDRIPGLFELHLFASFIINFAFLVFRNDIANDFIKFLKLQ